MKKSFILFLLVLLGFSLSSCSKEETPNEVIDNTLNNPSDTNIPSVNNPNIPSIEKVDPMFKKIIFDTVEEDYVYEGTMTVGPYKAYNQDGSLIEENIYMAYAIRTAAQNATNANKCYVLDVNGLKIFERTSKSTYYCYDGIYYVGTKGRNDAVAWSKNRSKSYIIDGNGSSYQGAGTIYYEGSDLSNPINLELFAGGYNYMYTEKGKFSGDSVEQPGMGYLECVVKLSDATYRPTKDDGRWNASPSSHISTKLSESSS